MSAYLAQVRRFNRDVRLYMLSQGIYSFALLNGIYAVLFNLYLLRMGHGPEFVGMVNSAATLGMAAFALPSGVVSRWVGLRKAMLIGLIVATVFLALIPLVAFFPSSLHEVLTILFRLGGSMGISLYFVNSTPYLMAVSDAETRSSIYSFQVVASQLVGLVGSLLGGMLPEWLSAWFGWSLDSALPYRYPLLLASAACLAAVAAVASMDEVELEDAAEARGGVAKGASSSSVPLSLIGMLALSAMMQTAVVGTSKTFFNVYLDDGLGIKPSQIGMFFAAVQLVSALAATMMPKMAERYGMGGTFVLSSLGSAAGMLPLALIPLWPAALVGRMGISAFASITFPALNIFQMELVAPAHRSTTCGIVSMARQLSWTLLSLSGGFLISALSYRALFMVAWAITMGGTALFWIYFRKPRGEYTVHDVQEGITCVDESF